MSQACIESPCIFEERMDIDPCVATNLHPIEFPLEIWERFFKQLELFDLLQLASTCSTLSLAVQSWTHSITMWMPLPQQVQRILPKFTSLRSLVIHDPSYLNDSEIYAICQLETLVSLTIGNLGSMENPIAFFDAIWINLPSLTKLQLDFGEFDPYEFHTSTMCTISSLNLTKLVLLRVPLAWNLIQESILSCMTDLEHLEITYQNSLDSMDFLKPLTKLKYLGLGVMQNELSVTEDDKMCKIPVLPALQVLKCPTFGVAPNDLKDMPNIHSLDFTPWDWKKEDLATFSHLPLLSQLTMKAHWLPSNLGTIFKNIKSLTLVEFSVDKCPQLEQLKDLKMLCLDCPLANGKPAAPKHMGPISSMLRAMPWLEAFSLVNVSHIPSDLAITLAFSCPSLKHLELSGCHHCLKDLFLKTTIGTKPIKTLFLHCPQFHLRWLSKMEHLEGVWISQLTSHFGVLDSHIAHIPWKVIPTLQRVETAHHVYLRPSSS